MVPPFLDPDAIADIKADALARFPEEACGLVALGDYHPMKNVSAAPRARFKIDALEAAPAVAGGVAAIVHSHPGGPDCPSQADMAMVQELGVAGGIVSTDGVGCLEPFWWGEGVPVPPLLGRPFRHGVTDCYSLIRDWYRLERATVLPDFPREWEWWTNGVDDFYRKAIGPAGFEIWDGEPEPGDVFTATLHADKPNHAGIYLGGGLILHHLTARAPVDGGRISVCEPAERWRRFINNWLRFRGVPA